MERSSSNSSSGCPCRRGQFDNVVVNRSCTCRCMVGMCRARSRSTMLRARTSRRCRKAAVTMLRARARSTMERSCTTTQLWTEAAFVSATCRPVHHYVFVSEDNVVSTVMLPAKCRACCRLLGNTIAPQRVERNTKARRKARKPTPIPPSHTCSILDPRLHLVV